MASPEKRTVKKTAKGSDWDQAIAKSRANIETRARNKNVRAEEAALSLWEEEEGEEEEGEEEELPEDASEGPAEKAPRRKAAAAPRSSSPAEDGTDEEEARNIAQVLADEKRFMQLKFMIHGRDQTPLAELELLDLPELEKRWETGPAKPSAAPKGKGKIPDAPPKKTSSVPPKKTTTKTPAKVQITKRSVCKVTALNSPLDAFNKAKEQSRIADSTPVPTKRTRDASADKDSGNQRPRLDFTEKSKASRTSAPAVQAWSFDNHAASTVTSRASSRVPSVAPSRSQSTAPSHPVPGGGPADFDGETFDLDAGYDGAGTDTEQSHTKKPVKQTGKQPKPRAKKADITDPQEKLAVSRTVEETVALLVSDMCANSDETEIKIRKAWAISIESLGLPTQEWQMSAHNLAVCKSLVSGFRSRGRQRTTQIVLSHFKLELSPDQDAEDIKRAASKLLPIEFLRDPEALEEDAGHYQSSVIARTIAAIWFTGAKPVTSRHPDLLSPVPVDTIAYVCALDILKRLAKDGHIKIEKRATTEEEKKKKEMEKARLKAIARATGVKPEASETRAAVDPVRELMSTHYTNLAVFQSVMGPDFDKYRAALYKNACKWAGKQTMESDDEGETEARPDSGVLTAASFAGDLRHARSRKAAAPTSDAHSQPSSKSSSKPKARPQPSSRLSDEEQQPDASPKIRRSSGHLLKDRDQPMNAWPDEYGEKSIGGVYAGAPTKEDAAARTSNKRRHADTGEESQEETNKDPRESYSTGETGGKGGSTEKRKTRNELTNDEQDTLPTEPPSEDEQPVKRPRLSKRPARAVPGSDDQLPGLDDQLDPPRAEPRQREAERENTQAVEPSADAANDPLATTLVVTGVATPSSPLSESPNPPEAPNPPSVPTKRFTRMSSQAAKEAPMLLAMEKRKQLEAERRERAAEKKQEEQEAKRADEANWEEMQQRAKKGTEGAKPKAAIKRKKKGGT
ncbi:hypothetical protein RhiLY_06915 [Ceratobasidium sp. AG-Ba]|nr:hypothetical protein RhiLY_06915 [Ceratobasidium sp. AG-Ba]